MDKPARLPGPWNFFRQEYYSRLPCPPPGDLPNPGIEPKSPASPAWAGKFFTTAPSRKSVILIISPQGRCCLHGWTLHRIPFADQEIETPFHSLQNMCPCPAPELSLKGAWEGLCSSGSGGRGGSLVTEESEGTAAPAPVTCAVFKEKCEGLRHQGPPAPRSDPTHAEREERVNSSSVSGTE